MKMVRLECDGLCQVISLRPWEHLEHHADHDEHHPEHRQDPDADRVHEEGEGPPLGILSAGHRGLHLVWHDQVTIPKHDCINHWSIHDMIIIREATLSSSSKLQKLWILLCSFMLLLDHAQVSTDNWPALADMEQLAADAVLLAGPALLVPLAVMVQSHALEGKILTTTNKNCIEKISRGHLAHTRPPTRPGPRGRSSFPMIPGRYYPDQGSRSRPPAPGDTRSGLTMSQQDDTLTVKISQGLTALISWIEG